MNPKESPEISVQMLLALRQQDDALRRIAEALRVREMGPADHIRTKHEAKIFIESGDAALATKLIADVSQRLEVQKRAQNKINQVQDKSVGQRL